MRLLLDTHYVYGLAGTPETLSPREVSFLDGYPEVFVISAVSIWEVRLKWQTLYRSGTRKGPADPLEVVRILSSSMIVVFLPLNVAHAAMELDSPLSHRDPFDELLLTQAQAENLKLLTRDRRLLSHPLATSIPPG